MTMEYQVPFDAPGVGAFDLVRRPRRARRLARGLVIVALLVGVALMLVPWQQTSFGQGQVVAFSPTERPQFIHAPVAGWLTDWQVVEGTVVAAGDPLVRIVDNDPELLERLARERAAADQRVAAAEQALAMERRNLRRQRELAREGLASTRDVELAQLQVATTTRELNAARAELARAETQQARLSQQQVLAPHPGVILRRVHGEGSVFVSQGDPLAHLVPDTESRSVELWMDGNDLPLLGLGRQVRIQFEGWPAIQFSGWPELAYGTFGGRVAAIDAAGGTTPGSFRVLITPLPDEPWPDRAVLRQGVRAHGWVLLDRVPLGFELWRRFNAFPPRLPEPIERPRAEDPAAEPGPLGVRGA